MNLQQIAPLLSQVMGRDISADIALLYRARGAVGAALNQQAQVFVSHYYTELPKFLESADGQKAIQAFVTAWGTSMIPKADPSPAQEPSTP